MEDNEVTTKIYTNSKGYTRHKKPKMWKPTNPDKCQAFASSTGKQCVKNKSHNYGDYCNVHRKYHTIKAKQLGPKNSNYKNGSTSKIVKQWVRLLTQTPEMRQAFISSLKSEQDQYDLSPAIALFDALTVEKLKALDFGTMDELRKAWLTMLEDINTIQDIYNQAINANSPKEVGQLITKLQGPINSLYKKATYHRGKLKMVGADEIEKTLERRAKATKTMADIQISRSSVVPVEVVELISQIQKASYIQAINMHVDTITSHKIQADSERQLRIILSKK